MMQTDFRENTGWNQLCRVFSHRGLISLNASVSYLIEPLPDSTDAQQHVVFRAESLHLPAGRCTHHHGNGEPQRGLNDFIRGMASTRSGRVGSHLDYISAYFKKIECPSPLGRLSFNYQLSTISAHLVEIKAFPHTSLQKKIAQASL